MKTKEQILDRLKVLYKRIQALEKKKALYASLNPNKPNTFNTQIVEANNDVAVLRWVLFTNIKTKN